ncbi:MAG: DUF4440 domain-containing protein [Flavobacteriales bacterium]|nr:DUF4440 domain-containing protein [Flavobacteriales bacterium]
MFSIVSVRCAFQHAWCFALLFAACGSNPTGEAEREIRQVMADQELAWDRGDIPAFMDGYADQVCFVSKKGITCGKQAVTANYLRSYPDKDAMGDLSFGIHEVVMAGDQYAWLTGTWRSVRSVDTLGGGFSLLWERTPEGWRILRDHTY